MDPLKSKLGNLHTQGNTMTNNAAPLISVIIPVWNPGLGISRCIESLQRQTLKEIEMIFVDDRGTDNSMDKVRVAAKEDPRVRILANETNMGAGPSRNRGIEVACGEYLSFVDPDDFVAADFLKLLYTEAKAKSSDIVKGSVIRKKEDDTLFPRETNLNQEIRNGCAEGHSLYYYFTYEHQSAVYRREFILSNNIRYGTSSRAQDNTFLLKACSQVKQFSLVDNAHYFFCARQKSSMHTVNATRLQGYLIAVREQIDFILNSIPDEKDVPIFLQGLFLNALKEYYRYNCINDMKKEASDFISGLQSELIRLPCCQYLSDKLFSLRALKNYCVGLPRTPYTSPWEGKNHPIRFAELTKCWIDFYFNHPNEADAIKKDVIKVLVNAISSTKDRESTYYNEEEKKQGSLLLKRQIRRLPLSLQIQLNLSLAKQSLRKILTH